MNISLVQFSIANLEPEKNRERVRALVAAAKLPAGSLVMLPELFSLGTLPQDFGAARAMEAEAGDRAFLAGLAREHSVHMLGSTAASTEAGLFNLSVLVDESGREVLEYRKIHPFSLGGEDRVFTGGESAETVELGGFVLQPAICYDLRFPELFRAGLRNGANLIAVQANWPESRKEHWDVLLRARAIENQSYVAGVNCTGMLRGVKYAGGSRVVSPKGEVLAEMGEEEGVLSAEISADHVRAWRKTFPALRDRRPDGFWEP